MLKTMPYQNVYTNRYTQCLIETGYGFINRTEREAQL